MLQIKKKNLTITLFLIVKWSIKININVIKTGRNCFVNPITLWIIDKGSIEIWKEVLFIPGDKKTNIQIKLNSKQLLKWWILNV